MQLPKPSAPVNEDRSPPEMRVEQQPDAIHDGAPAGRTFGSDLPVQAVTTSPFSLGGFSPQGSNPELPRDPMDGYTKPPTGLQR